MLPIILYIIAFLVVTQLTVKMLKVTIVWPKYFKPLSLAWWMGITPTMIGFFIASEPLHGMTDAVETLRVATGFTDPNVMIMAGLTAIGIRGKDG